MAFCSECGAQLPEGASFCMNCGAAVKHINTQTQEEPVREFVDQPDQAAQAPQFAQTVQNDQPAGGSAPDYQQDFYRKKAEEEQRFAQQQAYRQTQFQQTRTVFANVPVREIIVCVLLSIVTCGIYGIYWYYNVINEVNSLPGGDSDQSAGMVILLSIITCGIYNIYWMYKTGEKLDNVKQMNGEIASSYPILFLILSLLGLSIVNLCLIQNELNKLSTQSAQ